MNRKALEAYMGKRITLFCSAYIYTGTVTSIDDFCISMSDTSIVYETGPLDTTGWKDAQPLPFDANVSLQSIEMFCILK